MIYDVGPAGVKNINDLDWAKIGAGDTVRIHYRPDPYREIVCVGNSGQPTKPFVIEGVADSLGRLPVLDGNRAVFPTKTKHWNGERSLIHVGGTEVPADQFITDLIIRNLAISNVRFGNQVLRADGTTAFAFAENAAAVHVEKGARITFEGIKIEDCGCGFFIGSTNRTDLYPNTRDVLIRGCEQIRMTLGGGNGQVHANYTSAINTIFERCKISTINDGGSAIKSRDMGLTVRYCTIDGGNYCIDAVNSEIAKYERSKDPKAKFLTQIYGNLIIKRHRFGQESVLHFGKDTNDGLPQEQVFFHFNDVMIYHESGATLFFVNDERTRVAAFNSYFFIPNQVGVAGRQDYGNTGFLPYYGVRLAAGNGKLNIVGCVLPKGAEPGEAFSPDCFKYVDLQEGSTVKLEKFGVVNVNAILPKKFVDYDLEVDLGERVAGYHRGSYAVKKLTGSLAPYAESPLFNQALIGPAEMELPKENWDGSHRRSWTSIGAVESPSSTRPPDPKPEPKPEPKPQPEPQPNPEPEPDSLDARLVSLAQSRETILQLRGQAETLNALIRTSTEAYERELADIKLVFKHFEL